MTTSDSDLDLDLIRPPVFKDLTGVHAWFTLKNSHLHSDQNSVIPGLDLGSNTRSPDEVISGNRGMLYEKLGLQRDWVALADQVHGSHVRFVSSGGTYPETDALVTDIPGLALAIQVADCAAVLLADARRGMIAAVHAGWRGALGGILPGTIQMMRSKGCRPNDLRVFVSPCISLRHFEVGEEVAEQFPGRFVDREHHTKPHLDLKGFLRQQMSDEGINRNNIEVESGCTVSDSERFYSFRRENEGSGRMMGIIELSSGGTGSG